MNCPACNDKVKVLVCKPSMNTPVSTTTVDFGNTIDTMQVTWNESSKKTFKCCNEKCWVTRIEVDWGQS